MVTICSGMAAGYDACVPDSAPPSMNVKIVPLVLELLPTRCQGCAHMRLLLCLPGILCCAYFYYSGNSYIRTRREKPKDKTPQRHWFDSIVFLGPPPQASSASAAGRLLLAVDSIQHKAAGPRRP